MLKAIVFDFDGTLLESADIKTDAFATLFRKFPEHLAEILNYHLAHAGISRYVKFRTIYRDILNRPLSASEEQSLAESFRDLVLDKMAACPLVPGAEEFLRATSARYRCFIASGAPDTELRDVVARRDLTGYFAGVYGSPATKPEIIRNIRAQYHLNSSEMLCIGDALSDLQGAEAEGVPFVGRVHDGQQAPFPAGKPIMTFRDFTQLQNQWEALLTRLECEWPSSAASDKFS
jgi:HAD superfamily hydrolase (TIGR01549 family)